MAKRMWLAAWMVLALGWGHHAGAQVLPGLENGGVVPLTADCVLRAAALQRIPPQLILGLIKTEGGRVGGQSLNRNGSYDLGVIQINDRVWLPVVANMHFGGNLTLARLALKNHGCYNVNIGAWIFRQYLDEAGGNYATAVGWYNSHNEGPMRAYQARFAENFAQLFGLGGNR